MNKPLKDPTDSFTSTALEAIFKRVSATQFYHHIGVDQAQEG